MASYGDDFMGVDIIPASITGMSWRAQLAAKIYEETADGKMKAFFGEHGWNTGIINKMIYQAAKPRVSGSDKILAMSASTGVSEPVANSFYKNIAEFAGKDPTASLVTTTGELLKKLASGVGDLGEGWGKTALTVPLVLVILAAGVSGYLVFAGKKGTKLTPF